MRGGYSICVQTSVEETIKLLLASSKIGSQSWVFPTLEFLSVINVRLI